MTDRQVSNPGQYKAVVSLAEQESMKAGDAFVITLTRDDKPVTEGTPYNKESVLPDDLAEIICPDVPDPTPADALRALSAQASSICNLLVPVGYTFEWAPVDGGPDLSTAEKVAAYYGFGKWEAYGAGRMTLGASKDYAVGKTGGAATHKLTASEMPSHNHGETIAVYGYGGWPERKINNYSVAIDYQSSNYLVPKQSLNIASAPANADTHYSGGGQAHNNMPPYVVVYRWRRIA